jgi:hypothetical protein
MPIWQHAGGAPGSGVSRSSPSDFHAVAT